MNVNPHLDTNTTPITSGSNASQTDTANNSSTSSSSSANAASNVDTLEQQSSSGDASLKSKVLSFWNSATAQPSISRRRTQNEPNLANVCHLSRDADLRRLADKYNLSVVEVAWEDMSRFKFSSVGDNITDATLRAKKYTERCSIIRPDNYKDHTGDFGIEQFRLKVGNEQGEDLETQSLRDYLNDILGDVIAESREILVSAQTCVLPLHQGKCEFNMELFNYQTSEEHPACLAIIASASGTSAQVITKNGAQPLFFRQKDERCSFFAERLKEVRAREGRAVEGAMNEEEEEKNILLMFQVPLKQPERLRRSYYSPVLTYQQGCYELAEAQCMSVASKSLSSSRGVVFESMSAPAFDAKGVDHAQLGVTEPEGRFENGPEKFKLEIDPKAAIRCTVQHYLVTDKGTLSEADVAGVRDTMNKIYSQAKKQGSLVVDGDSDKRSTAPANQRPFDRVRKPWFIG